MKPLMLAAGLVLLASTAVARADMAGKTVDSVQIVNIDHTEIVDDQNILFYMLGKDIYLNTLPYKCSGLKFEDGFSYETSLSVLTDKDIITVLRHGAGPNGPSCGLGDFKPVTKAEADQLKADARAKRTGKAAPAAPAQ